MQIVSSVLIGAGIVFMLLSIHLTRQLLGLQEGRMFKSWKILLFFIVSFALAYVAALVLVILDLNDIIVIITGMVFMGGAMFVFLVIRASLLSSKKLIETASSKKYLNDIFHAMDNILIVLDENQNIKTVNPATCQKLGCEDGKIIGRNISELVNWEDIPTGQLFETTFNTKSGKKMPVLVSVTQIKDFTQEFTVIVAQDISRQKDDERKLIESLNIIEKKNNELDQFAYIVSHDLKAPLRAINSLSGWIIEDMKDIPEDIMSNLKLMQGRVQRMDNLINGILEYSRVGRQKLTKQEVDIKNMVKEIVDTMNIEDRFIVEIQKDMPKIMSEFVPIQQVFSNLISNAIKYHDKEKGNIQIGVNRVNSHYEFFVKDDGPGISKEYHDKIFGIFQTIEARDTKESTGIGLAIIKKIVEEKNGKVWVESEEGSGSTFHFSWPGK